MIRYALRQADDRANELNSEIDKAWRKVDLILRKAKREGYHINGADERGRFIVPFVAGKAK